MNKSVLLAAIVAPFIITFAGAAFAMDRSPTRSCGVLEGAVECAKRQVLACDMPISDFTQPAYNHDNHLCVKDFVPATTVIPNAEDKAMAVICGWKKTPDTGIIIGDCTPRS